MASLSELLDRLSHVAPLRLAQSWDNTGLLLEGDRPIHRVLLTIDLTASVCEEAVAHDVDLVVAYHPPIFRGLKRLTRADGLARSLLTLARRGVHLYSPHTALDAVPGGMNDWLLDCFEPTMTTPIEPDSLDPAAGIGRIGVVQPASAASWLPRIKAHLGLSALRVAGPLEREVRRVAVCPGSGGSVFAGLADVDLLLTGEMGHHDVLGWAARGTVVVLTEHTNTERGYLPLLAAALRTDGVEFLLAATDTDPLQVR